MKLTADNVLWFIYQYNCSVGHPTIIRRRAFEKEFTAQWHTIEPIVNQLEQIDHLIVKRHVFIYDLTEKGLAKAIEMTQYEQENVMVTKRFWMEIGRYLVGLYDRLNSVNCLLVLFSTAMAISANATTWYVTKSGNDSNTGKSVSAAFLTIQKAVDVSVAGDEILVSSGTYSFIVVPAEKEPLTIRATDTVSDTIIKGDSSNYKRCVTVGSGVTTNVFVIGFTLTGGRLSDSGNCGAGAMGGTYSNCTITANSSGTTAAGAYKCTLYNCTVSNNQCSDWTGGMEGCTAVNCLIQGNSSTYVGSGGATGCILIGCTISGNSTSSSGGGGGCRNCKMYRCRVEGNSGGWASEINGGEIYDCLIVATGGSRIMCAATCYNCTIVSSVSAHNIWRDTRLYNCLLSGKGGGLTVNGDSNWKVDLMNCFLEDVTMGGYTTQSGCLSGDAKFAGSGDYHLQKASPCIDVGDNSYVVSDVDFDSSQRIYNGTVDIGAYEYHSDVLGGIGDVIAKQRYPWNGLVDLSFVVTGESETAYKTSFVVNDLGATTNVDVRTLYASDGSHLSVTNSLKPGVYKWVWDASQDLPSDFVGERMVIVGNVAEP